MNLGVILHTKFLRKFMIICFQCMGSVLRTTGSLARQLCMLGMVITSFVGVRPIMPKCLGELHTCSYGSLVEVVGSYWIGLSTGGRISDYSL